MTNATPQASELCPACQHELDPTWSFCGSCGTPRPDGPAAPPTAELATVVTLPQTTPPTSQPVSLEDTAVIETVVVDPVDDENEAMSPTPKSRWRRRLLTLGCAAVLLLAVVAVGLVVANEIGTHHRLDRTRTELSATESQLASTRAKLGATTRDLAGRTTERDALQSQLNDVNTQLQGVRGTLSDTQNRVSLQAGQISSLKSCLNGVSTALSDAAYGDYSGAVGALDAVQISCRDAKNAF